MIHGIHGQHAQDLQRRGIISDTPDSHFVIVPITRTNTLILSLLESGVKQPQIANFAGIMMTSPNAVTNLHFLFGPNATKNLKVAVAGNIHTETRDILDRASAEGIEIIETTRTEHDKHMALIQGVAHMTLLLAGESEHPDTQSRLIRPWITPTSTITDMIFANAFAEERAIEFFDILRAEGGDIFRSFRLLTERHISDDVREKFSTPNFERILSFDGTETISLERLESIRRALNEDGRTFIEETVGRIRGESA